MDFAACYEFFPGSIVLLFAWVPKTPYTVYLWPHLIFIITGKVRNRDTLINKKIITVFSEASLLFSFLYCKQWDLIFVGKEKKKQEKTCIVRAKQVDKILRHTLKCVLCHFMWLKVGITFLCGVGRNGNGWYEKNIRTTMFIVIYRDSVLVISTKPWL